MITWKPWEVDEEASIARIDASREHETAPIQTLRRLRRLFSEGGIPAKFELEVFRHG